MDLHAVVLARFESIFTLTASAMSWHFHNNFSCCSLALYNYRQEWRPTASIVHRTNGNSWQWFWTRLPSSRFEVDTNPFYSEWLQTLITSTFTEQSPCQDGERMCIWTALYIIIIPNVVSLPRTTLQSLELPIGSFQLLITWSSPMVAETGIWLMKKSMTSSMWPIILETLPSLSFTMSTQPRSRNWV